MERNILNTQQKIASKEAIESDKTKLAEENDRLLKLTEERIALERKLSTLINSDVDISKLSLMIMILRLASQILWRLMRL